MEAKVLLCVTSWWQFFFSLVSSSLSALHFRHRVWKWLRVNLVVWIYRCEYITLPARQMNNFHNSCQIEDRNGMFSHSLFVSFHSVSFLFYTNINHTHHSRTEWIKAKYMIAIMKLRSLLLAYKRTQYELISLRVLRWSNKCRTGASTQPPSHTSPSAQRL